MGITLQCHMPMVYTECFIPHITEQHGLEPVVTGSSKLRLYRTGRTSRTGPVFILFLISHIPNCQTDKLPGLSNVWKSYKNCRNNQIYG